VRDHSEQVSGAAPALHNSALGEALCSTSPGNCTKCRSANAPAKSSGGGLPATWSARRRRAGWSR